MKLITNANLELIIKEFYELLQEEFKPKQLEEARTLTIGETGKKFDGSQDVFWSLNEIGAAPKDDVGSISNLTTSNKSSVVAAINELQNNKATIAYVNDAINNVEIEDVVTASEFIGNIENIENDYVTQDELEDALANLDDIDIEGMVTAVDVGNVDIEQGGGNNGGSFDLSGITMYDIKAYVDDETATVGSEIDGLWAGYNELFQSANNGKELIASAIGKPLSAEDTFSAMSTKINTLTTNFKSALLNKGIAISGTDTFQSLISKIESISDEGSNTGSSIKMGELSLSPTEKTFTMSTYYNGQLVTKDSTEAIHCWMVELDFAPIIFNATVDFSQEGTTTVRYTISYNSLTDTNAKVVITYPSNNPILESNLLIENNKLYIPDLVLSEIVFDEGNSFEDFGFVTSYTAIGIGEQENSALLESLKSILQEEGVTVTEEDNMASLISKVDEEFNRQVVPQGTATVSDVVSGKTFINSTGQLLTGTASASENGLVLKTGTVTTGDNGIFEISNLDIEPLIFWATTDCTRGIEEISYNRYKSTDSFETSLYLGEESTNTFDKLYFSNFGSNYNIGVTNNRIRLFSAYGTTVYYNILGIGEGGNVSGGGSSSGNYHTIMENNALVNNYQFFNSASSYGNNFQHSNTTGLYSSSLDSGYVSYITLISTIDFNNYSAIEIDAFNYHSGSSTEFCVFASSKALNQISKTSINTIVSMTDEKTVSSTNTSTFTFDLSDFSGTYYLGIARVGNSTTLYIKGIRLIKSNSSGSGSQVQPKA